MKPSDLEKWERPWVQEANVIRALLATDVQEQENDSLLYTTRMSEEELKKLKGVVIATAEFCVVQRDSQYVLPRLKDAGVYLDHADYAGQYHGFGYFLSNQGDKAELFWNDYINAIEKHVMQ